MTVVCACVVEMRQNNAENENTCDRQKKNLRLIRSIADGFVERRGKRA